jgi:hypothetical protein
LTRRANHRHIFIIAILSPRRETGRGLFSIALCKLAAAALAHPSPGAARYRNLSGCPLAIDDVLALFNSRKSLL